jgi:EAL domain-containing protein (putative c-di-GMP-specific phosphodiesterase class I)
MHLIGLLFYIGVPIFAYYVDAAREFIVTSFNLSPEITVLIGIAYVYPLTVFLMSVVFNNKGFANINYFRSQVTLSSTLAVSFGLIGTFIGLSQMIAGIAAGMGAYGDFTTKMTSLLGAISVALDSMSLAFLTSILGVGASVSILFSSNYLASFYREFDQGPAAQGGGGGYVGGEIVVNEGLSSSMDNVKQYLDQTMELVSDKEKMWSDLYLLLENGSRSEVVGSLNRTLVKNTETIDGMREELQALRNAHLEAQQANSQSLAGLSQQVASSLDDAAAQVGQMTSAIGSMATLSERNTDQLGQTIMQTSEQLKSVADILQDIRIQMAIPLEEALKSALRTGEGLDLVFQPQVNQHGQLAGAEVFVRWTEAVRGLIPNSVLFEVAEESSQLVSLDKMVLKQATAQVKAWQQAGHWQSDYFLSINISHKSLVDPSLLGFTESLIEEHDLKAEQFVFEVTENTIMSHPEEARDKMRQISRMGVRVFIDDFGTGYSSLMNLKNFQIDRLKIDKDIVQDALEYSEQSESIIRSIMNIATELNIEVSAEGIETQDQLDKLVDAGCSLFQGYYLGRPEEANDFLSNHIKDKTGSA